MHIENSNQWKRARLANGLECYTPQPDQPPRGSIIAVLAIFTIALTAAVLLGLLFGMALEGRP